MRVISGKLKGRVIQGYNIEGTRPTMDRVKESVMASIQDRIDDSIVLDLFAGSGNLGIEAISNGACQCYFVDRNKECIRVIKKNIQEFGIQDCCVVIENDYKRALDIFRNQGIQFDLIFVDPPYRDKILLEILEFVRENHLLVSDGIIVLEYQDDDSLENVMGYQLLKVKKYGDKYVSIYQNLEN